ncbi:MAG: type II secretion system secretin GspD [Deltaproteobacteria bacterium]|nr:type II secretion system secretin GspD [Deltaproteobacteria bacterium]
MCGSSDIMSKHLKAGWLPGMLMFILAFGLLGCAGPAQETTAPLLPESRRTPVKVFQPSAPPERKSAKKAKPPEETPALEERGLETFTTRLKKIPTSRPAPKKGEKVYPIDLNLKNADLVEAIRVLAETMGLNYSVDPKVKGTVNVRATGKLSESELLSIMETLLTINGATMIKGPGDLYKIVPMDKAAARALPVYSQGAVPQGMRAQVIFLEQTPAKEMVTVLKPLLSPAGSLGEAAHNALILIDTPDNMEKLLQLINLIDSRALAQTLVRIVKVHNSAPKEVIAEMETIFAAYGTLAAKGKFGVNFLPVARLNSVMILANSGPLMERALYWVRQLDAKTDMLANVHVYNVENYKAKNLANLLTQVYGGTAGAPTVKETTSGTGGGTGGGAGGIGGIGGMGGTSGGMGGIGMGGSQQQSGAMGGTMSGTLGTTGGAAGRGGGIGGTPGGDVGGGALKERATGAGGEGSAPKEGVRIIPDDENNLLVVVAPPYEWNIISRILKQLDIMPRQVLNEVLIAEVTLTDDLKYGIEFLLGGVPQAVQGSTGTTTGGTSSVPAGLLVAGSQQGTNTTVTGPSGGTTNVTQTPAGGLSGVAASSAAATFTTAGGFSFLAIDAANKLRGLINLLASEGKVQILASPHIMAANNQEARIQIGSDVPTLTSQSVPLISQTTSFQTNTVQYRSTGIILSVKPQINAKGLVTLDIAQEVSNVDTTSATVSGSPNFTVRSAKTTLTTADNQTVVLGGLIREDKSRTQAGIPGLRKIPILGPLFGSDAIHKERTELLVLITPHIITNMEEGARVTQDLKDKVHLDEAQPTRRDGETSDGKSPGAGSKY